jgi:multidrug efflux pump subunit AcrA (membrane-fusion protein)
MEHRTRCVTHNSRRRTLAVDWWLLSGDETSAWWLFDPLQRRLPEPPQRRHSARRLSDSQLADSSMTFLSMTFSRLTALVAALSLVACGKQAAQPPAVPPSVEYVTVEDRPVTLTNQLPGRTSAYETSDVRPQVNGLVEARLFTEGDLVREGQPLYRIDALPYEAQVANAQAALARARAAIASSAALARGYGELVKTNAISKQNYENAQTSADQAEAEVAAQEAALRTAQINLARTTIRAPITGRIGRSIYTTEALATASQTEPLATIHRLDPIYVDIQQSSTELLKLHQQLLTGRIARNDGAQVKLILEDYLRPRGNAAFRRRDRRPGDGIATAPSGLSQSRRTAAAGHVRTRPARRGHGSGDVGSAARRRP